MAERTLDREKRVLRTWLSGGWGGKVGRPRGAGACLQTEQPRVLHVCMEPSKEPVRQGPSGGHFPRLNPSSAPSEKGPRHLAGEWGTHERDFFQPRLCGFMLVGQLFISTEMTPGGGWGMGGRLESFHLGAWVWLPVLRPWAKADPTPSSV